MYGRESAAMTLAERKDTKLRTLASDLSELANHFRDDQIINFTIGNCMDSYINKVPTIYHKILPRNNISNIIDSTAPGEAICLMAPYGYGKTLAVISWLQSHGLKASWLNLNESDNVESGLTADLSAAMLSLDKKEILNNPAYMEDSRKFLFDAISQLVKNERKKILVIDNFSFIKETNLIRLVRDFILACLGQWKVFIISRVELSPLFNDLILKGHLRLISPKELNFNIQETNEYFMMNGCEASKEDATRIHSDTEGWAAALNAVLAVSAGGCIRYGEAEHEYIKTFFETEIWSCLDGGIKDFLMKTSILEKLTPSVCHTITGIEETLPILKWLCTNGHIVKLMEENTYRYHRIFRDYLLDKLIDSNINETELYTKVAWWFFERDETAQSFPYFYKASNYYGISQVLKILNPAEMGMENYLEMAGCLTRLDAEKLSSYPVLVAEMALINFIFGNVEEMRRLTKIYLKLVESGELLITSEEYGEYMWEAGWLNYIDPAMVVKENKKHEEWSNYEEYVPYIKPIHYQRYAVLRFPSSLSSIRDYCSVVYTIDAFIEYNKEAHFIRGEYALFEQQLISAEYAYETEKIAKAEEDIRKVLVLAESKLHIDLCLVCIVILVKTMRAANNTREIGTLIKRLEDMIIDNDHHYLLPNFHAFQLRNNLAEGHAGFTEIFMEENEKYKNKPCYFLIYRQLTYVRGLLSLGDYTEAMLILGSLELLCSRYERIMDMIELNILKSIALYGLKREDKACLSLMEALKEAEPYGFIRVFSDNAAVIWNILELVKKRMNSKYVQNIVISCKKSLTHTGYKFKQSKYAHIELTKTELKILKSLKMDMSYTEIALDNDIRMSTVKSHVHSIYSKLEVSNKTSAVIVAENQGIIN